MSSSIRCAWPWVDTDTNGKLYDMSTHIHLLGGLKPRPYPTAAEDLTLITVLGGISLDLSEAELASETRITKVSAIGGVDLTVPQGTNVIVRGFHLLGGSKVSRPDPYAKNTVIVSNWGLIGGVSVTVR